MKQVEKTDYRNLLKQELELRCQKNPRYSLRSFARDLKMAPSRLSDVLRGRYGLSKAAASDIARRLSWNEHEQTYFCDLVESQHGRSITSREQAKLRLVQHKSNYHQLSLDAFQIISDWHHYAILELMNVTGFKSDIQWIAKRLGISTNIVAPSLERLKRLEMIEEVGGHLEPADDFTASPSGTPSDALKKFHRQVLEKAISAISLQTVEERDFSSLVMAIDTEKIPEASLEIKKFRRKFDAKFGASAKKNEVYCLAIQFFSLENQRSELKEK